MCASILLFSWHHTHSYLQILFFAVCPPILLWSSLTYSILALMEELAWTLDPGFRAGLCSILVYFMYFLRWLKRRKYIYTLYIF